MRPKKNRVTVEYLFFILQTKELENQYLRYQKGSSTPTLSIKDLLEIEIPIPLIDVQIDYSERSKKIKKSIMYWLNQRENFGELVDEYLMRMLDLEIERDETYIYEMDSDQLTKENLSVEFYKPKYQSLVNQILKHSHKTTSLQEITEIDVGIIVTKGRQEVVYLNTGNINENGVIEICQDQSKWVSIDDVKKNKLCKKQDILMINKGSNAGVCSMITEKILDKYKYITYSNNLIKIKVIDQQCLPEYLMIYLNSLFGRLQIQRWIGKKVNSAISLKTIKGLQIIMPNIDTQNLIENELRTKLREIESNYDRLQQELEDLNKELYTKLLRII